jgi:hypothetical protein
MSYEVLLDALLPGTLPKLAKAMLYYWKKMS